MRVHRSRPFYAALVVLVIGTGLLWRSGRIPLSSFLSKYGGDALWALVHGIVAMAIVMPFFPAERAHAAAAAGFALMFDS